MKTIMLLGLSLLLTVIHAKESPSTPPTAKVGTTKTLESIGKNYMALLNRIGADQTFFHGKDVVALCAPECKRFVNGALWFEESRHFIPHLLSTGEKVGFWKIQPLDVIPGQDGHTVVVHFLVHTEKAGVWNTLVILRCNEKLLITEIDEVFNSFEGTR